MKKKNPRITQGMQKNQKTYEGETALSAVLAVEVVGHEDTGTARLVGALASQARDLAVAVDLVVLQHSQLHLLLLVLDLLGGGVVLLLALLGCKVKAIFQLAELQKKREKKKGNIPFFSSSPPKYGMHKPALTSPLIPMHPLS